MANTVNLNLVKPTIANYQEETINGYANNFQILDDTYEAVDDRIIAIDNRLIAEETGSKYFWIEEHTILQGDNTLTLINTYGVDDVLVVKDRQYGLEWFSPENYTLVGQVMTFDTMAETLTFRITNLG